MPSNLPKLPSLIWKIAVGTPRTLPDWNTEYHIEIFVSRALGDIVDMLNLAKDMIIYSQVKMTFVQQLVPNITAFIIDGIIVGVCAVKKPSMDETDLSQIDDNLQNQMIDYL